MAEAMLAHPPSYFGLERSLHVKPREIDWMSGAWTWKRGKGGPRKVIAGGREGQRPASFAKKTLCSPETNSAPVGMPDPWKSPIPLEDTGLVGPIKDGIRALDSPPLPIHTRLRLESDFGLLPLVYCG